MAKGTRHAPADWPQWPYTQSPTSAPAFVAAMTLDAVGEKIIFGGYVMWADGGTHDWRSTRWLSGSTSLTDGTLTFSARLVDAAAGPPLRDDGVVIQSGTHVNPASATIFTSTFGTDVASVATGAEYCFVFEVTARVAGSIRVQAITSRSGVGLARPQVTTYLSSAYAAVAAVPTCTLVASDGTLGIFVGGLPNNTATPTVTTFANDDNPDERALTYTPTEPHWGGTFSFMVLTVAGGDFDLVLYEDTTPLVTKSIDSNTWAVDAGVQVVVACFPDVAFTSGNIYYLSLKPTTASTDVTFYLMVVASGDLAAFAQGFGYATRNAGGSWSAVSATQLPIRATIGMIADDDGAGAGGGNANILTGSVVK